jgi:hypothetical protein
MPDDVTSAEPVSVVALREKLLRASWDLLEEAEAARSPAGKGPLVRRAGFENAAPLVTAAAAAFRAATSLGMREAEALDMRRIL